MGSGFRGGSRRGSSYWRIGRLVCGVAALMAALAGLAAFASAQPSPRANPELTVGCGLKVALVLDESQSISNGTGGFGATQDVRSAATAFTEALEGTGSPLALTSFHSIGRSGIPYQDVTPGNITTFTNWIGTGPDSNNPSGYNPPTSVAVTNTAENDPNGTTNWQDGFQQVLSRTEDTAGTQVLPDLVVFVTDGNPNTVGGPPRPAVTTPNIGPIDGTGRARYIAPGATGLPAGVSNQDQAANVAEGVANQLKAHARIFGIFVGPDTAQAGSTRRIQQVTGTREGLDPISNDYAILPHFDDLKAAMTGIVARLCGSTLDITKQVPGNDGEPVGAPGWTFRATLDPAGGHTWLDPTHGINGSTTEASARLTTGSDGVARFAWNLNELDNHVDVTAVKESGPDGFHFVSAQCRNVIDGVPEPWERSVEGIPGPATLGREDYRECYVLNRPSMAQVTVVKHLEPDGDPGRFILHLGSQEVTTPPNNDPPGSLTGDFPVPSEHSVSVSESSAHGTDLAEYTTKITCVDLANPNHVIEQTEGPGPLQVHLEHDGQHIQCTITNVSTKFGQIAVIKHLIPEHDPGKFHLHITPGSHISGPVGDTGDLVAHPLQFGTYQITETAAAGTNLDHYNIHTICMDENADEVLVENAHGPQVTVELSRQHDNIQCTITNERLGVKVGRLEVVKHLVPHDDAGSFDLLIGGGVFAHGVGHNGTTGPLDFELGTHTVTEHGVHGTDLADFAISTTCVDKAHGNNQVAHNAHGPSVTVHLNSESDNIVCTITNTRTAPPEEGGVEVPETPGPHLGVVKTMPARAQVGELVPISVVVHNHGHSTAHGVQLAETRPAGLRIVHVGNHGTLQHGAAVWHLGDLAPGETRTVHATARVLHTGLHVDTAVATALNADPALSNAAVRAARRPRPPRRPAPPPPPFTG